MAKNQGGVNSSINKNQDINNFITSPAKKQAQSKLK